MVEQLKHLAIIVLSIIVLIIMLIMVVKLKKDKGPSQQPGPSSILEQMDEIREEDYSTE